MMKKSLFTVLFFVIFLFLPQKMHSAPVGKILGKFIKDATNSPAARYYISRQTIELIKKNMPRNNKTPQLLHLVPCPSCSGKGKRICNSCHGSGMVGIIFRERCSICKGEGKNVCISCFGRGYKIETNPATGIGQR